METFPQLYDALVTVTPLPEARVVNTAPTDGSTPGAPTVEDVDEGIRQGPSPDTVLQDLLDLTKRHARMVLDVLGRMTARHLAAFVAGDLAPTCLVNLAAGELSGDARVVVEPPPPALPRPLGTEPPPGAVQNGARPGGEYGEDENVFAFEGEWWTLAFGGAITRLQPSVGLSRLACLLADPGREFTAGEILARTAPAAPGLTTEVEAERHGMRPDAYAGGGTVLDPSATTELREAVKALLRERDDLRDAGDGQRAAHLDARITQLAHELQAGTGLGGRLKPFADNMTRSHEAVYQSIHRTLPKIAKAHPSLGAHLRVAVRRSTTFAYQPETSVRWRVVLPRP